MSEFEEQLRRALRRREPPEGFAERVLAKAATLRTPKPKPRWRWALAAAATVLITAAGLQYHQEREMRIRGERAKEQVVVALQFAGAQVHLAQQKVLRLSENGEDE